MTVTAMQQLQELQFRKMSQTSFDIRTSLYIDTLQSQSLHDRSLEVNMDAVEDASVASLCSYISRVRFWT